MYTGNSTCLFPSWPQIMQKRISFRSRSDLVLDAHHALDYLSDLVLQACISFCSVSDKSGRLLLLPCSHKNAVAHIFYRALHCLLLRFGGCETFKYTYLAGTMGLQNPAIARTSPEVLQRLPRSNLLLERPCLRRQHFEGSQYRGARPLHDFGLDQHLEKLLVWISTLKTA